MDELKIRVEAKPDGMIEISFPNADIIETEHGPMMGFRCTPDSALYAGGAIIHAAFSVMGLDEEEEENEDDE